MPQSFQLNLTEQEVNIALLALSKAPMSWEMTNPVIMSVKEQAEKQLTPPEPIVED